MLYYPQGNYNPKEHARKTTGPQLKAITRGTDGSSKREPEQASLKDDGSS